jgi:alpha-galactosidase
MSIRPARIVVIGAGSASFGLETLFDLFGAREELAGSTIVLVDVDAPHLEKVAALARLADAHYRAGFAIESTTDRRAALRGAQFVITAVAVRREELWKLDFEVPIRHGVKHVLGENGGPGALFHSARSIGLVLPIARDMEEICPDALLLNFTNPMSRVCRAVARYTRIRTVGLCHQIGHIYRLAGRTLDAEHRMPQNWDEMKVELCRMEELYDVKAAGINHFTWLLDLRSRIDGCDLYPEFRRRIAQKPPDFEPLSRFLMNAFGLIPATGDQHAGEYLAFAHEFHTMEGYDFDAAVRERAEMWARIDRIVTGTEPLPAQPPTSGERVVAIICAVLADRNLHLPALNLPNEGFITNLPAGAIVEVPGTASGWGVRGLGIGELPRGIAELCRRQLEIQELVVEAVVTGSRTLALQALLLDPLVPGAKAAAAILDDLLRLEADALPMFA